MIIAVGLAVYAVVVGMFGPRILRARDWASRAPRLAIATWQAAGLSVALALVFAGLSLAIPSAVLAGGLAGMLRSCAMALREAYATPGGAAAVGTGLVLAVGVTARIASCITHALMVANRDRRAHRGRLQVLGRPDSHLGATVIDSETAAAYCLPGREHRVVVSTAALAALSQPELAAVLAHERAHLAGRHHLVMAGVEGLRRAFPRIPLFAAAPVEVGALVEMLADDRASQAQPRPVIASALVRLAGMHAPVPALPAGGKHTLRRVLRLRTPTRPLHTGAQLVVISVIALMLAGPAIAAAAPAAGVIGMQHCPLPQRSAATG